MASVPYISVQPDYPEVLQDVMDGRVESEKAWLSVYASNAPDESVHARLTVARDSSDRSRTTLKPDTSRVEVHPLKSSIQVSVVGSGIPKPRPSQAGRSIYRRQDQIVQQAVSVLFPKYTRRAHPDSPALTSTAGIQAMDLSPTANELYVVGGGDGELLVGTLPGAVSTQPNDRMDVDGAEIEQRAQRRMAQIAAEREAQKTLSLTGHVGDIRSARFFPSGEVILTTSSDMSVRIFSVRENSNPRTLLGHKRAVLCSEIIGRGRQVLTGGADGTVRLWDVSKGTQVTSYSMPRFSAANAASFPRPSEELGSVLAVGLASGGVQLVDVRVPPTPAAEVTMETGVEPEFPSLTGAGLAPPLEQFPPAHMDPPPSPRVRWAGNRRKAGGVSALTWKSSRNQILAGSSQGIFSLIDPRMLSSSSSLSDSAAAVVTAWERSDAAVTDICTLPADEFLATSSDGLPHRARIPSPEPDAHLTPEVLEEYAGWDTLPANCIRMDHSGRVVVAGSDGYIRRY